MNFKTTFLLLLVLGALVAAIVVYRPHEQAQPVAGPADAESALEADLITDDVIDTPVRIVCQWPDQPAWAFERDEQGSSAAMTWRIVEPVDAPAVGYEVDRIGRQLIGAKYEISYLPSEPGAVTAEEAGLAPPRLTVELVDAQDKSVTVEVGHAAGPGETYARIAGEERICVVRPALDHLVKDELLDYRERLLWGFTAGDAEAVEIVDNHPASGAPPVTYRFERAADGHSWLMTAPADAPATGKVDEFLTAFSRLRVQEWVDEGESELPIYGLSPPALTVRVTVPSEPEADEPEAVEPAAAEAAEAEAAPDTDAVSDDDTEAEPAPPEPTVYTLHVADRSPIGQDTLVYVQPGDQAVVGTLLKATADKLRPTVGEWRQMAVTTAPVRTARRLELVLDGESAAFEQRAGRWINSDAGWTAQQGDITALLQTIAGLQATAFVDGVTGDLAPYGLAAPRAVLTLYLPGSSEPEVVRVGDYTDPQLRRLVYVQCNASTSIAKVRAPDVEPLLRRPDSYRDRSVFSLVASRLQEVQLTATPPCAPQPLTQTLTRTDGSWQLVAPVESTLEGTRFDELVEVLANLTARTVIAEPGDPAQYGLDQPAATVQLTYRPPVTFRAEPVEAEETPAEPAGEADADEPDPSTSDEAAAAKPAPAEPRQMRMVEVQPPDETYELHIGQRDGQVYVQRVGEAPVYEVAASLLDQLQADYRERRVLTFDESAVVRFTIRHGESAHGFERVAGSWRYAAEPDWPVDQQKVQNLLLQLGDLKLERFIAYGVSDLGPFGLAAPAHEAVIEFAEGDPLRLAIADQQCHAASSASHFACRLGDGAVFLITPETLDRLAVSLDELEP